MESSKELIIDTSCCAGYQEFTFFRSNDTNVTTILNSTASNYIAGTVAEISQSEISVTFASLLGSDLNEKSIQVIPTTLSTGTEVIPVYSGNSTVGIQWGDIGPLTGVFTIRIWTDQIELI